MYDVCHPSYYKIGELGCQDDLKITTAFYVYIELCEVKNLWDVEYKYQPTFDLIYLIAKATQKSEAEIYVPWPAKNNFMLSDVEKIQKDLNIPGFILVLKSGESSSMFYNIERGLKKPLTPEGSKRVRLVSEKKWALNNELRRNSGNLYDLAKIEIDDVPNNATNG